MAHWGSDLELVGVKVYSGFRVYNTGIMVWS